MSSFQRLRAIIGKKPSQVFILSDDDLLKLARSPGRNPNVKTYCLSELLHRSWLFLADSEAQKRFRDSLSHQLDPTVFQCWIAMLDRMEGGQKREMTLPPEVPATGAWLLLQRWLSAWSASHGAIIFVPDHGQLDSVTPAMVTPFILELGNPEVVDRKGNAWPEFSEVAHAALKLEGRSSRRARLPLLSKTHLESLQTSSAALPLAYANVFDWPKMSRPVLSVLMTGALNTGEVQAVSYGEAKAQLAARLGCKIFVSPKGTLKNEGEESVGGGQTLDYVTLKKAKLEESLEDLLPELGKRGLTGLPSDATLRSVSIRLHWSLRLASRPVADLFEEVQSWQLFLNRWDELRLAEYKVAFMSSEASALCHLGQSKAAIDKLNECRQEALSYRLYKEASEATIHHVVVLTDLAEWKQAELLGQQHFDWLNENELAFSVPELIRQRMMASGTLGQALMFQALQNPDSKNKGRKLLEQALGYAQSLGSSIDVFKDLNYLALWRVLHDPNSAQEFIKHVEQQFHSAAVWPRISAEFLQRIKLFFQYRKLLIEGIVDDPDPLPSCSEVPWLHTICLKYRGALLAAQGQLDESERCFDKGLEEFRINQPALFQLFGLSLCLEASLSLRSSRPIVADRFFTEAKGFARRAWPRLSPGQRSIWKNWNSAPRECMKRFAY